MTLGWISSISVLPTGTNAAITPCERASTRCVSALPSIRPHRALAAFTSGEKGRFHVFAGPIKDNRGNVVLEEGEMLEQADLDQFLKVEEGGNCKTCMKFWVEGITGELPE